MGVIRINNLKFHTFNGVFPEERKWSAMVTDVALHYPIEERVQHDEWTKPSVMRMWTQPSISSCIPIPIN